MKFLRKFAIPAFSLLFAFSAFIEASASTGPDPIEKPFTVAWMTDTQCLVYYDDMRDRFYAQMDWLQSEYKNKNIQLLIHTGDIMDNGFVPKQVMNAEEGFSKLDPQLPVLAIAGNHDISMERQSYERWGDSLWVKRVPEQQRYKDGRGVYDLIEVNGRKLLFVGLGYKNADEEAVEWVKSVFAAHPDALGIFFTHSYIDSRGLPLPEGRYFDEHLLPYVDNLRLVLCGHSRSQAHIVRTYPKKDGSERTVDIVMWNFYGNSDGAGAIRLLRFDPTKNRLSIHGVIPYEKARRDDFLRLKRAYITIDNIFPE